MTKAYFESLDEAIARDKSRLKRGLVIERHDDREVYTQFGTLRFKRTYYHNKKRKEYVYLLDQVVGLEAYSRISAGTAVELINHAARSSYGESSQHISNGEISRQTVMKKVKSLKKLQSEVPEKRSIKILQEPVCDRYQPSKKQLKNAARLFDEVMFEKRDNVPVLKTGKGSNLIRVLKTLKDRTEF